MVWCGYGRAMAISFLHLHVCWKTALLLTSWLTSVCVWQPLTKGWSHNPDSLPSNCITVELLTRAIQSHLQGQMLDKNFNICKRERPWEYAASPLHSAILIRIQVCTRWDFFPTVAVPMHTVYFVAGLNHKHNPPYKSKKLTLGDLVGTR